MSTTVTRIDAMPVRATGDDTAWNAAIARRGEIAETMRAVLAEAGVAALVFNSVDGIYPPWVRLEAWLPGGGAVMRGSSRERVAMDVTVDVLPYHRHTLVTTVKLVRGRRAKTIVKRPGLTMPDIREWTLHAVRRGPAPRSHAPVRDALLALIPFVRPHHNPVRREFRRNAWITWPRLLVGAGVAWLVATVMAAAVDQDRYGDPGPMAQLLSQMTPLVLIVLAAAAGAVAARRRRAIAVIDQPTRAPRNLVLVDSWHAVVAGLGRSEIGAVGRLQACIEQEADAELLCEHEVYGTRTPNGFEERERLVVTKGQAVVHVHLTPFHEDLFVGWNAFLNWAKWDETQALARRVDQGQLTEFRSLRQGLYVPNQFDLIDLNSLGEFVHRRLVVELKALLREQEIDQEIDFRVIRGDRESALDEKRHAPKEGARGWRVQARSAA